MRGSNLLVRKYYFLSRGGLFSYASTCTMTSTHIGLGQVSYKKADTSLSASKPMTSAGRVRQSGVGSGKATRNYVTFQPMGMYAPTIGQMPSRVGEPMTPNWHPLRSP